MGGGIGDEGGRKNGGEKSIRKRKKGGERVSNGGEHLVCV